MSAQGSRFLSSSTMPKTQIKRFVYQWQISYFFLIAVQNLLPRSANRQSGVLMNDFPDMHLQSVLWVIGDKMLRIAKQSWPRGCVTVIGFICLWNISLQRSLHRWIFLTETHSWSLSSSMSFIPHCNMCCNKRAIFKCALTCSKTRLIQGLIVEFYVME